MPRQVKALARRSAFNSRAEGGRVVLVDGLEFEVPKTSRLRDYLGAIATEGKVLILTHGVKRSVHLSARNLPDVRVRRFGDESPYDILWARTVVIEREALDELGAQAQESEE